MHSYRAGLFFLIIAVCCAAQDPSTGPAAGQAAATPTPAAPRAASASPDPGLKTRDQDPPPSGYRVEPGTRILLNMINSVSTRQAAVGDRIYLETAFPVLVNGHIVIPQGSWVTGTVTSVKRPGRVKGRGELSVRFDSLTLPNGISRDFRAPLASVDSRSAESLDRESGTVKGPGGKGDDLKTVAETTAAGAGLGTAIGAAKGSVGKGIGIGAGAGLAAGLVATMLTRGPDATLDRGTNVEMVLDRPVVYNSAELDFSGAPPHAPLADGQVQQKQKRGGFSPFPY